MVDLLKPPKSWFFEIPDWAQQWLDEGRLFSTFIDEEGRFGGYVAQWDTCYVDGELEECWQARPDPGGYREFMQGKLTVDTGEVIDVGVVAAVQGHSPSSFSFEDALRYTSGTIDKNRNSLRTDNGDFHNQIAYCRAVDTEKGLLLLGSAVPDLDPIIKQKMNASAISGEWFPALTPNGDLEYYFAGPAFVNKPALPLHGSLQKISANLYDRITDMDLNTPMKGCADKKGEVVTTTNDSTPQLVEQISSIVQENTKIKADIDTLNRYVAGIVVTLVELGYELPSELFGG